MSMQFIDKLKRQFQPNKLFLFNEIKEKGLTEAALKEELLRLTKTGEVKRFAYGIYYLPDPKGSVPPTALEAITLRYLTDGNEVYGFFTGSDFLGSLMGRRVSLQDHLEIMTNKATSGKKTIYVFSKRISLRKPYFTINKNNISINSFLSYLSTAPLDEVKQNYSLLANYIRSNQLSANDVMKMATAFPTKTSAKLLASDLYRSLWKH
jgi:hypothetical protein